ncbi:hypothetical protein DPMN_143743 [Dreissena polymorpha]|uniref:Uncharacterized protein n=1 Tax=Dreissena polymorpha TaxID=45954 RepID=A0A9D4GHL9_DREPO|nr:hypothetical protein DPMN_143743 [Dreissena polymorpha]
MKAVLNALQGHLVKKYLHSQTIADMTQEDLEIQILLYYAEELYFSLLCDDFTIEDAT